MRSPLQGGLPPVDAVVGAVVEIACDESGFSGTNLLHSATPVITHASVDLRAEEAIGLITALRSGFRFSPREFKSGQFLRGRGAAEALEWFLAALHGRARVQLVDKEFFLVTRIVDLLVAEPSYAAGTRLAQDHRPAALALYRARRSAGDDWGVFLAAFVDLVRVKRRHPDRRTVERFFQARDALVRDGPGPQAETILNELSPTQVRAVVARLHNDDRSIPPPLEPMLSALAETVLSWSAGQRQVLVTHDEQSALTAPVDMAINCSVDSSGHRGWQGNEDDFAAFATHAEDAVAVFLAEISDAGAAGFEDPQPEQAEQRDEGEVVRVGRQPRGGDQGFELEMAQAECR